MTTTLDPEDFLDLTSTDDVLMEFLSSKNAVIRTRCFVTYRSNMDLSEPFRSAEQRAQIALARLGCYRKDLTPDADAALVALMGRLDLAISQLPGVHDLEKPFLAEILDDLSGHANEIMLGLDRLAAYRRTSKA